MSGPVHVLSARLQSDTPVCGVPCGACALAVPPLLPPLLLLPPCAAQPAAPPEPFTSSLPRYQTPAPPVVPVAAEPYVLCRRADGTTVSAGGQALPGSIYTCAAAGDDMNGDEDAMCSCWEGHVPLLGSPLQLSWRTACLRRHCF